MNDLTFKEVLKLDPDIVLENKDETKLYARSFQRLKNDTFLNDEIIEACISQILKNNDVSYYIDTFLKMKLIKMKPVLLAKSSFGAEMKEHVTDKEWIIIPLNVRFRSGSPNHWTVIIINVNNATFFYLDSFHSCTDYKDDVIDFFEEILDKDLEEEHVGSLPLQGMGSVDCGVYAIKFVESVIVTNSFEYGDVDMPGIRKSLFSLLTKDMCWKKPGNENEPMKQVGGDSIDDRIKEDDNDDEDLDDDTKYLRELAAKSMEIPIAMESKEVNEEETNDEVEETKTIIEKKRLTVQDYFSKKKKESFVNFRCEKEMLKDEEDIELSKVDDALVVQSDDQMEDECNLFSQAKLMGETVSAFNRSDTINALKDTTKPFLGTNELGQVRTFNTNGDWKKCLRFNEILYHFAEDPNVAQSGKPNLEKQLCTRPEIVLGWISNLKSKNGTPYDFQIGSNGNFLWLKNLMKKYFNYDLVNPKREEIAEKRRERKRKAKQLNN